jgi:hypothetical protein
VPKTAASLFPFIFLTFLIKLNKGHFCRHGQSEIHCPIQH